MFHLSIQDRIRASKFCAQGNRRVFWDLNENIEKIATFLEFSYILPISSKLAFNMIFTEIRALYLVLRI